MSKKLYERAIGANLGQKDCAAHTITKLGHVSLKQMSKN